jgi:hypothetical protein
MIEFIGNCLIGFGRMLTPEQPSPAPKPEKQPTFGPLPSAKGVKRPVDWDAARKVRIDASMELHDEDIEAFFMALIKEVPGGNLTIVLRGDVPNELWPAMSICLGDVAREAESA